MSSPFALGSQFAMFIAHIQQAIFASSNRGPIKGYHLVAFSPGLKKAFRETLSRWSPTQLFRSGLKDKVFSAFPLDENSMAIARTVLGGPEYSQRGDSQVITRYLILTKQQYAQYHWDPISVGLNALAMGFLRLPLDITPAPLDEVMLPEAPIIPTVNHISKSLYASVGNNRQSNAGIEFAEHGDEILNEVMDLLLQDVRIAVVGCADPASLTSRIVAKMPNKTRERFSVTTGIPPSIRRPFQLHFLPSIDEIQPSVLKSQGIHCLQA